MITTWTNGETRSCGTRLYHRRLRTCKHRVRCARSGRLCVYLPRRQRRLRRQTLLLAKFAGRRGRANDVWNHRASGWNVIVAGACLVGSTLRHYATWIFNVTEDTDAIHLVCHLPPTAGCFAFETCLLSRRALLACSIHAFTPASHASRSRSRGLPLYRWMPHPPPTRLPGPLPLRTGAGRKTLTCAGSAFSQLATFYSRTLARQRRGARPSPTTRYA